MMPGVYKIVKHMLIKTVYLANYFQSVYLANLLDIFVNNNFLFVSRWVVLKGLQVKKIGKFGF